MKAGAEERGVAVIEMVVVLPILLVLLFAVIDLGRAILVHQVLTNISREAANLASRGTSMSDAIAAVLLSAEPLDMSKDGFVILSEVSRDSAGQAKIKNRASGGGSAFASQIGPAIGANATMPPAPSEVPPRGQTLFAAEVFYRSSPVTPLGKLFRVNVNDTFYDAAFF